MRNRKRLGRTNLWVCGGTVKKVGRVWLTLHGSRWGTVCFTDAETDQLRSLLAAAKAARPRP